MISDLILNAFEVVLAVGVLLFLCAGIGLLLRRPILEGLAVGLLFLAATSGVAYYLSRAFELKFSIFVLLSLILSSLLILGTRKFIFTKAYCGRPTGHITWIVVIGISAIIGGVRLLTPMPQAAYSIFQAWYPLYLEASVDQGYFLKISDMTFGPGFLATHALYSVDSFAVSAILFFVTGLDVQSVILATSISTVIAAFSVLAFSLRRSPIATIGFAVLFLFFFRFGHFFRGPLVDNAADHLTYLAGATAVYYLVAGEAGRIARIGSALMMAPAVMARPSGAVYSAIFALSGFLSDLKKGVFKQVFLGWCFFAFVLGVMTFREIIQVFQGGIFGARPGVLELFPPSFTKSFWGILNDWGLTPHSQIMEFSIPMLSFAGVAMILKLWTSRSHIAIRPRILLILFAPLLILVVPMMVEVLTGFRKYSYGSKLYFVALFLYPWYPLWLVSRLPSMKRWPNNVDRAACSIVAASLIIGLAVFIFKKDYVIEKYKWAVETYTQIEPDSQMASAIRQRYPTTKTIRKIIDTPIIYFYYEPGAGLRYYLGGKFFSDFDFWSNDFQARLENAEHFEDVLKSLGYPNLYFSYTHAFTGAGKWVRSRSWKKFESEINNIVHQNYVKDVILVGDAKFVITSSQ